METLSNNNNLVTSSTHTKNIPAVDKEYIYSLRESGG